MKTTMRFEREGRAFTFDEVECPFLPEGTLVSCGQVAAARVVTNFVHFHDDDTVTQWIVAK